MSQERKAILHDQNPFGKLIFSIFGVIIIGLIFQLIGMGLAALFFDISVLDLTQLGSDADVEQISALKLIQIVGALGTFVFSSFLISRFYTGSWLGYFSFGRYLDVKLVVLLIIIMVVALPFVNMLSELNTRFIFPIESIENYFRRMEEQGEALMMTLISADKIGGLLINIFMIAIIPAIGEELVFRGLIQRHLTDLFKNAHIAIVVAAMVFSLAHFQIYSFLPRFFLGLILGYTFYYGKSLWYPMIAHLVNNTMGVIFYFFYMKSSNGDTLEELGTSEMLPVAAIFSLLAVIALMFVWIKMRGTSGQAESLYSEINSRH